MRIMKLKVRQLVRDISHPPSANEQFQIIYLKLTHICLLRGESNLDKSGTKLLELNNLAEEELLVRNIENI